MLKLYHLDCTLWMLEIIWQFVSCATCQSIVSKLLSIELMSNDRNEIHNVLENKTRWPLKRAREKLLEMQD